MHLLHMYVTKTECQCAVSTEVFGIYLALIIFIPLTL